MPDFKGFVLRNLSPLGLSWDREAKVAEELAAHLQDAYESLVARGLSGEDAWRELQTQMPDWEALRDELLEAEGAARPRPGRGAGAWGTVQAWLRESRDGGIARDLRSSLRLLARDRGFAATTLLTLAACLGANAAIFTVVHSILLRPLPFPEADRIVALGDVYPTVTPDDILSNTAPSYFDRLEALTALDEQAMFAPWYDTIAVQGVPEEIRGMRATPSLFRLLRVHPAMGRTFVDAEGEVGAAPSVILSHGLWQRLYGGDPSAIGRELRLGWTGRSHTIVGVMPRGFSFFEVSDGHARAPGDGTQFWIPLAFTPAQRADDARTRYGFHHVGRIRPGATIEQARAQLDALNAANFERFPELDLAELGMYTAVTPLQDALTHRIRRLLYLLWGGAAFVLLIGALNVANLCLVRASVRARELATRLALGAGRFHVARQLVLEGVLLAGSGGVAGLGVGAWMLEVLLSGAMASLPNAAAVRMDETVVAWVAAASVLTGILIGLAPAAAMGRLDLRQALAQAGRLGTAGRGAGRLRRGLVAAQVGASVVLLIGAGLFLASFRNLLAVDAGFDPEGVTTATIFPPPSRYEDQRAVARLSDRLLESVRGVASVEAAGLTSNVALSGHTTPAVVSAAERAAEPGEAPVLPSVVSVTPGYFEAMRTPLVRGRYFTNSDREDTLRVAIVDERLARRLWPGEDPIGKGLHRGDPEPYTVVGVVRDVRLGSLVGRADSSGTAYFPHTQAPPLGRLRWIAVRTSHDSAAVVHALRSALAGVDPELPLSDVQTMTQRLSGSVVPQKLAMSLASAFGLGALFLSAVGLYGVLSYVVAQREREIGIRMALGSTAGGVFQLVLGEGLRLVAGGIVLGLLGALAMGRALEGQVFGVAPTDPLLLGSVALSAGIVALLACLSPAWRATRVDPLRTLSEP